MFSLSKIEHKLILPPHLLSLPLVEAIKGELERLFLDKVFPFLFFLFLSLTISRAIITKQMFLWALGYPEVRSLHLRI